ncbi:plasmid pRiA4b ORF-3 family protein [Mitsuokella jalaludinii]|uniref:plasmid pRiA4b ORF-3 family protein n=1 Tax=Mitsuokella jalaludinii TaxID=187979 RepID=UPI003F96249A
MEAYQFKIQIEGARPTIWRRCFVPVHMNLFQFSYAIQLMFGWSGDHLADFSKEDGRFCVPVDTPEAVEGSEDGMPEHRASETDLADFFGSDQWIHYTYDFGDEWVHRVTREGMVEDYPYDYPQVIKAQGDDPAEDCGGVDALNAGRWAEERTPFDAAFVNDELQEPLFRAVASGQETPDWHKLAKEYRDDSDLIPMCFDEDDTAYFCIADDLTDTLAPMTKSALLVMAERKGFPIKRSLCKADYCQEISRQMLSDEVLRSCLLWLSKEEMMALVSVLQDVEAPAYLSSLCPVGEDAQIFGLPMLHYLGYVAELEDDKACVIPQDAADAMRRVMTDDFWQEYRQDLWIEAALSMSADLYLQLPWTVFMKILQQVPAFSLDARETLRRIREIPAEMQQFVCEDGILHLKVPESCLPNLPPVAADADYYIPSIEEIWKHDLFDAEGSALLEGFLQCAYAKWPDALKKIMASELSTLLYAIVHADSLEVVQSAMRGDLDFRNCGLENSDELARIYRRDVQRYLSELRAHVRRPEFHGFTQAEQKNSIKASCQQAMREASTGWTPKVISLVDYRRSRN